MSDAKKRMFNFERPLFCGDYTFDPIGLKFIIYFYNITLQKMLKISLTTPRPLRGRESLRVG